MRIPTCWRSNSRWTLEACAILGVTVLLSACLSPGNVIWKKVARLEPVPEGSRQPIRAKPPPTPKRSPEPQQTNTDEALRAGIRAYEDFEYRDVIRILEQYVQREHLTGGNWLKAQLYLGASYYLTNQNEEAKTHFDRLLGLDPTFQIDRDIFKPEIVELFESRKGH